MIDGVDTTEPVERHVRQGPAARLRGQVQVKASGYTAEYRASLGGVISAITKSGGNSITAAPASTTPATRTCRATCATTLAAEPVEHDDRRIRHHARSTTTRAPEPIFDLGGPIKRDRLWFYAGYDPSWTETHAHGPVRVDSTADSARSSPEADRSDLSTTTSAARSPRTCAAGLPPRTSATKAAIALPAINTDGTSNSTPTRQLFPLTNRTRQLRTIRTPGVVDWVVEQQDLRQLDGDPLQRTVQHDVGTFSDRAPARLPGVDEHLQSHRRSGIERLPVSRDSGEPAAGQRLRGLPVEHAFVRDDLSRFNVNADMTRYGNWRGQHTLKARLPVRAHRRTACSRASRRRRSQLFWNAVLRRSTTAGAIAGGTATTTSYASVHVRAISTSNNLGLFVQDAWTLNSRLTLNLGVRTESEDVPSYRADNPGVDFSFGDKIAPRVGFAWDVTRRQPVEGLRQLGDLLRSDEADARPRHVRRRRLDELHFTLDTFDWPSIPCGDPPSSGSAAARARSSSRSTSGPWPTTRRSDFSSSIRT